MKRITIDFPGLSLLQVREQFPDLFYTQSWYESETFAKEVIPAGKWEVSLEAVTGSLSKSWSEQQKLLKDDTEVPPAAVLVYAMYKHFKDTGERPFESLYVRTSSLDSDGFRVDVGVFDAEGLLVRPYWDDNRHSDLGIASARKLNGEWRY